jgi:hypothetical protein
MAGPTLAPPVLGSNNASSIGSRSSSGIGRRESISNALLVSSHEPGLTPSFLSRFMVQRRSATTTRTASENTKGWPASDATKRTSPKSSLSSSSPPTPPLQHILAALAAARSSSVAAASDLMQDVTPRAPPPPLAEYEISGCGGSEYNELRYPLPAGSTVDSVVVVSNRGSVLDFDCTVRVTGAAGATATVVVDASGDQGGAQWKLDGNSLSVWSGSRWFNLCVSQSVQSVSVVVLFAVLWLVEMMSRDNS